MGSGKSTVGAMVARETGRAFVDVDVAIASLTGKTVRELWEEGGEAAYRELEARVTMDTVARSEPTVLAAPGGVVLDARVCEALASTFVVWLRTDPTTLTHRVQPSDHRPLLSDNPGEVLAAMSEARSSVYQQLSNAVVDTDHRDAATVATMVVELVSGMTSERA